MRRTRLKTVMTKKPLFLALFMFALVGLGGIDSAFAQSVYYVRPGASGSNDGSSWTNAYTQLPASLKRGATYYLADGSYGSYTFDDPASGSSFITVIKATASDHGSDTGWASSYGDGQAEFSGMVIKTSYYRIDGNKTSGYGIYIPHTGQYGIHVLPASDYNLSDITVKSVSINSSKGPDNTRSVRIYSSGSNPSYRMTFSNIESYGSGADCFAIFNCRDSIFEYIYLHSKRHTEEHGDGFEIGGGDNVTIRYSRFNWEAQILFWRGDFSSGSYKIYGNVFYDQPTSGKPIHTQSGDPKVGPLYIYNNTFVNVAYAIQVYSNTTGVFQNNLIYDNTSGNQFGSVSHSYNASDSSMSETGFQLLSSNPFVNSGAGDFRISKHTNPGTTLISPYNTDMTGTVRGADGTWDRGAYQYGSSAGGSAPATPAPPVGLTVN